MAAAFSIQPLDPTHDRKAFECDVPASDRYLREQATQDIRRRISNCFVACNHDRVIAGYYTFAATSIPLTDLPAEDTTRLPRYGVVPAALIGRLAVDRRFRGQGLGGALIIDAVSRAAAADAAIHALLVDAKDGQAAEFYEHLGFRRFGDRSMLLFLPIAMALKALQAAG